MTQGLMALVAMAMVFLTPVVLGTSHLSFSPNATVNIARPGCGMTKLCVESPEDCDPAGSGACLFFSVNATGPSPPNGFDLAVQLRGDAQGYVALALTANATMGTSKVFVCGNNSGTFLFRTVDRNNSHGGGLTPNERTVRDIRGSLSGSVIQCEFTIPMVNASTLTRHSHFSSFVVLLGTGDLNGTVLGDFNVNVTTGRLNLNDPASNVAMTTAGATMAGVTAAMATMAGATAVSMTTSDGLALRSQAVLVLLGTLAFLLS